MMNKINGMKESLSHKKLHLRGDLLYLNCYDFKSVISSDFCGSLATIGDADFRFKKCFIYVDTYKIFIYTTII